ncbi:MAG: hypothetical protein LBR61_09170 [Synergistaceae bacterium]|jgi:hypothetical protein|nr:hypothetical protein [Synergistaceae bacterium]
MAELGTYQGRPMTPDLVEELSAEFERDWDESEVIVASTSRGKALRALQALELPIEQIEALECRARHEQKSLTSYLRSILQNELVV